MWTGFNYLSTELSRGKFLDQLSYYQRFKRIFLLHGVEQLYWLII
jgi:hypothetical protein